MRICLSGGFCDMCLEKAQLQVLPDLQHEFKAIQGSLETVSKMKRQKSICGLDQCGMFDLQMRLVSIL